MEEAIYLNPEQEFRLYVRWYNKNAREHGKKMFRGTTKPQRMTKLRDLLNPRRVHLFGLFATNEEEEKFRADFFRWLLGESLENASTGAKRRHQVINFGRSGAEANKQIGDTNFNLVTDAARAVLAERTRKPSDRELASLIEKRVGIPLNTVRGHLTKLRKSGKMD